MTLEKLCDECGFPVSQCACEDVPEYTSRIDINKMKIQVEYLLKRIDDIERKLKNDKKWL